MFNGIVTHTGIVKKIYKKKSDCIIEVFSKLNLKKNEIGSSISCSGICLTVDKFNKNLINFYVSSETLKKTNFKYLKINDLINIEKSLKYGQRISGHFVQGHVDTTSIVKKIDHFGKSWLISFILSKKNKKYLVQKGSITINGVSLTIAEILNDGFQISVIPKTLQLTNLINLQKNDFVNIEFDVLGKYIRNFIK
jgi:riboflavin synthase